MGTGISLIVDWENGIYSLGLGLSHWEWEIAIDLALLSRDREISIFRLSARYQAYTVA